MPAFRQVPLNEFLLGQQGTLRPSAGYLTAFGMGEGQTADTVPYNANAEYGMATGDYAGAGGPAMNAWLSQQVLGGQDPNAWFRNWNAQRGINQDTFQGWDQGGARYNPATGMVTVPGQELGGDEYGGLAMAGATGFLGGVGGLGSLSGLTGGADLGAGGLASAGGTGAGATGAFDMGIGGIGESMGLGTGYTSPVAGVGGLDPSWGANPVGNFNPGSYSPSDPLGLGGADTGVGSITNTTPDLTGLAPTQNLGTGSLYAGGGTGAAVGGLSDLSGVNLNDIIEQGGNVTNGPTTATGGSPSGSVTTGGPGPTGPAGTALSRIMGGTGTAADWASILGTAGSTFLGMVGSNNQADALRDIANQARTDRAPFLNAATGWMNDPASYYAGAPAQAAMNATLRGLSVNGNPLGSGTSLALANEAGLRGWQNAVTGFGNLGLSGQDSRNSILASAAGADRGITTSLASGLGSLTQPDNSLESLLRQLRGAGLNTGNFLA